MNKKLLELRGLQYLESVYFNESTDWTRIDVNQVGLSNRVNITLHYNYRSPVLITKDFQ